jgi:hypothetical protein
MFPFLAVLLCAMGSLILLLLVLDRRAKIVAHARALQAVQAAQEERRAHQAEAAAAQEAAAERRAAWERQRQVLHEQLLRDQGEVLRRLAAATGKKQDAARRIEEEQQRARELEQLLQRERTQLNQADSELASNRAAAEQVRQLSAAARVEAVRLAAQLDRLEAGYAALKQARQRDARTYSLVPYKGRRGESRRPIYLECTARGLVFHPDRLRLEEANLSPGAIRREVERRITRQQQEVITTGAKPDNAAYLLMLIRPDGITHYYVTLAALKGLEIDFGYEFVDPDWLLDFGAGDSQAQPWMKEERLVVEPASSSPKRKVAGLRQNDARVQGPAAGKGRDGETVGRNSGETGGQPGRLPPQFGSDAALPELPGSGQGGSAGEHSAMTLTSRGREPPRSFQSLPDRIPRGITGDEQPGLGLFSGSPYSSAKFSVGQGQKPGKSGMSTSESVDGEMPLPIPWLPSGGGFRAGPGNRDRGTSLLFGIPAEGAARGDSGDGVGAPASLGAPRPGGSPAPADSRRPDAPVRSGTMSPPGGSVVPGSEGQPAGLPPLPWERGSAPGGVPGRQSAPRGVGRPAEGKSIPGEDQSEPDNRGSPPPAGLLEPPPPRKPPPRPRLMRLIGNRDWIIPVECTAEGVVLRSVGQTFSLASLTTTAGRDNPLVQAVAQLIARRQASVRPGDPPYRPQVRFLVHPGGLRTYHLAYPDLELLQIPLTWQHTE